MQNLFRPFITIACWLLACCHAYATGFIARTVDPIDLDRFLEDFPVIVSTERAGRSSFFRFEVDDSMAEFAETVLTDDQRILWIEREVTFDENGPHSSHGSSVAAIYDRKSQFERLIRPRTTTRSDFYDQIQGRVRVGIVDTGVSSLQPELIAKIVAGKNFISSSLTFDDRPANLDTNGNGAFDEGVGHGTMVAGIIAQSMPGCSLVIAKSADSDGIADAWSVLQGIVFCVENRAKVINVSLGSSRGLVGFAGLLEWVEERGSIIVAPIGNDNQNYALFPAAANRVVCVSGVASDNTKAVFSNWSPSAMVAAPATGILGEWYDGGMARWSGTSFAAPTVTAAIALALEKNPRLTPSQIRRGLHGSGRDIDHLNPRYSGHLGRLLDVENLLRWLDD